MYSTREVPLPLGKLGLSELQHLTELYLYGRAEKEFAAELTRLTQVKVLRLAFEPLLGNHPERQRNISCSHIPAAAAAATEILTSVSKMHWLHELLLGGAVAPEVPSFTALSSLRVLYISTGVRP